MPLHRPITPSRAQMARTTPGISPETRPCDPCCTRVLRTSSGWSRIADVNPDSAPKRRTSGDRRRVRRRCFVSWLRGRLPTAEVFGLAAYRRRNAVRGPLIRPLAKSASPFYGDAPRSKSLMENASNIYLRSIGPVGDGHGRGVISGIILCLYSGYAYTS